MSAQSAQLIEQYGRTYRKVIGNPAVFLHNDTYLDCDTAMWDVDARIIHAIGHVRVIQNRTVLQSDKLDYDIDGNLAQFRGGVVQLEDKDHNVLRTRYLDFNTKDSVAVFQNGGAMKDSDGEIIESLSGTYDSKIKTFTFYDNVNMFSDSVFVKTSRISYQTALTVATFGNNTNAWKENDMLSANGGWYNRNKDIFFFTKSVHVMTPEQEGWSDSLYYYRTPKNVEMLGHVQISDTTRNVFSLAGHMFFCDTLSQLTLTRKPAVVMKTADKEKVDTVYFGGDTLVYRTRRKCDIDSVVVDEAESRLKDLNGDPVTEYRKKAAAAAAEKAAEAAADNPDNMPDGKLGNKPDSKPDKGKEGNKGPLPETPPVDTLSSKNDTLSGGPVSDSLSVKPQVSSIDSTVIDSTGRQQKDTSKIGFLLAVKNVKLFRNDIQIVCDSLEYNDLDSLIRLYRKPVVWNELSRQYSADSIYVLIRNKTAERANLMSDAFIITQEDSVSFDQIKSTEMVAYFDSSGTLKRFDALGDAMALFYLKEHDALATVNKVNSKMLYAVLNNGEIERIYYFDASKNDAYPVVQLPKEEKHLKGFEWQPDRRPKSKNDITPLDLRPSQRELYDSRPRTTFYETNTYFPGYMDNVYKTIARNDSLRKIRAVRHREEADSAKQNALKSADSLSLSAKDSTLLIADSLGTSKTVSDTTVLDAPSAPADTITKVLSDRQRRKQVRIDARNAKIALLQKRADDKKAAEKKAREIRLRKKIEKILQARRKQDLKDSLRVERYKARYEKRKARIIRRKGLQDSE
jgi:lipopolysaccharide export system protein LptA